MSTCQPTITKESFADDLRAAGIEAGDILVVHSSMRQVGRMAGGLDGALDALMEVLTHEGTLVLPTFTFNLASWNMPPFEPWRTTSRVGRLTDCFWQRENVVRTAHPTHSVAVWGAHQGVIASGLLNYEPLGINSPLDRARRMGAKILLMGVGNERNSTVHVAESMARAPYLSVHFDDLHQKDIAYYRIYENEVLRACMIDEMPGSSEGFVMLNDYLEQVGVTRRVRIGEAPSWIMDSNDLCRAVVELLRHDPTVFLRGPDPSEISVRRRRYMDQRAT